MNSSRRKFLAGAGYLTVSFAFWPVACRLAHAEEFAPITGSLSAAPDVDAWIRIGADGMVTIFTGKIEMGQGIRTALLQIAADELDLSLSHMRIAEPDTASSPDEGDTSRSHSIIESGGALRAAAAYARVFLLDKASQRLGEPVDDLHVVGGVVFSRDKTKQVSYGELIGNERFERAVVPDVPTKHPSQFRYVGRPVQRIDIPAKVSGGPSYVQDLRLPGMVHGRICRPYSDHSNIKLISVDEAKVLAMPGVIKVVRNGGFLGVIAEREEQAISAVNALRAHAQWETPKLPPRADLSNYLSSMPSKRTVLRDDAEVSATLDAAAHVVEGTYLIPFHSHASIGPSCAVAHREGDGLTIWTHSQGIFGLRNDLAQVLGHPKEKMRVIHMEGSGCYGQNGADDVALDAALLALAVPGRPVRVQWMRQDEFAWEPKGPAMLVKIRAAANDKGDLVAWEHEYWSGPQVTRYGGDGATVALAGWHIAKPPAKKPFYIQGAAEDLIVRAMAADSNVYEFPNKRLIEHVTEQFSPLRTGELRGVSAYGHALAEQATFDLLASKAGLDPIDFRLRFVQDARMREVIESVVQMSAWRNRTKADGRGLGFSFFYYDKPFSRSAAVADLTVDEESGEITVHKLYVSVDVGQVINPDGLRNQIEGGVIQALSRTLKEEVRFDGNAISSVHWGTYPILTFTEIPDIEVKIIERMQERPGGAGEVQTAIVPAAVANAVYDAVGARLYQVPFTAARVKEAIRADAAGA